MTAILSSLGCVKDYTPPSPIYFQLIDFNKKRHAPSFQC